MIIRRWLLRVTEFKMKAVGVLTGLPNNAFSKSDHLIFQFLTAGKCGEMPHISLYRNAARQLPLFRTSPLSAWWDVEETS